MVRGPWSVVRSPWFVIRGPWSVARGQKSVVVTNHSLGVSTPTPSAPVGAGFKPASTGGSDRMVDDGMVGKAVHQGDCGLTPADLISTRRGERSFAPTTEQMNETTRFWRAVRGSWSVVRGSWSVVHGP